MDFSLGFFNLDNPIISLFEDEETRWQALVTRNPNADGFFIYGVKTTKIYCRPICKARLARRSNVAFFEDRVEAVKAGYRPCKRCKPDLDGFMPEEEAVRKIREFVKNAESGKNGGEFLSLRKMAERTGLSKWHFWRVFKKCVGMMPGEYAMRQRQGREIESIGNEAYKLDTVDDGKGIDGVASASTHDNTGSWLIEEFLIWPEEETTPPPTLPPLAVDATSPRESTSAANKGRKGAMIPSLS